MKNYVTRRNNDIFEDTFNSFFRPFYVEEEADLMKTDIKETDGRLSYGRRDGGIRQERNNA